MTYNDIITNSYAPVNEINLEPTRTWLSNFENLRLFLNKKSWDNLREDRHLYLWSSQQRERFNSQTLSLIEFEKLRSIAFIWNLPMYKWDANYSLLQNYYKINNGKEPLNDKKKPESERKLGIFVMEARKILKKMSSEASWRYKYEKLKLLKDFVFEGRDKTWFKHAEAIKTKIENGTFESLPVYLGVKDYSWLILQWNKFNGKEIGHLASDQNEFISSLDLARFFNLTWDENYLKVKDFHEKYGKLPWGKHYKDLQGWLNSQRKAYKDEQLDDEKRQKLEDLGYDLSGKRNKHNDDLQWKIHYKNYKDFINKHNKDPTANSDKQLYNWVQANRQVYAKTAKNRDLLEEWKIELLNKIEFAWRREEIQHRKWSKNFNNLCLYLQSNLPKNISVSNDKDIKQLYTWFGNQKTKFERGDLLPDYQLQFESVGINLNVKGIINALTDFHSQILLSSDAYIQKLKCLIITEIDKLATRRVEHSLQKKILFNNRKELPCSICGKVLPVRLLVVSHIKRRSKCSYEEKINEKVVMTACIFGCDSLYERGYIAVENGKIVKLKNPDNNQAVENYIDGIKNRLCSAYDENTAAFFLFHHSMHKNAT